jgi:hypothetical protein
MILDEMSPWELEWQAKNLHDLEKFPALLRQWHSARLYQDGKNLHDTAYDIIHFGTMTLHDQGQECLCPATAAWQRAFEFLQKTDTLPK